MKTITIIAVIFVLSLTVTQVVLADDSISVGIVPKRHGINRQTNVNDGKKTSEYDKSSMRNCIEAFDDRGADNWLVLRNNCIEAVNVIWICKTCEEKLGSSALIKPGGAKGSGLQEKEWAAKGGLALAVCKAGYWPVSKTNGGRWEVNTDYICKKEGKVSSGNKAAQEVGSGKALMDGDEQGQAQTKKTKKVKQIAKQEEKKKETPNKKIVYLGNGCRDRWKGWTSQCCTAYDDKKTCEKNQSPKVWKNTSCSPVSAEELKRQYERINGSSKAAPACSGG